VAPLAPVGPDAPVEPYCPDWYSRILEKLTGAVTVVPFGRLNTFARMYT
jgi:hypothetical protein